MPKVAPLYLALTLFGLSELLHSAELAQVSLSPNKQYAIEQKISRQSPFTIVQLFLVTLSGSHHNKPQEISLPDNIAVNEATQLDREIFWSSNSKKILLNVTWRNSEQQLLCRIDQAKLAFTELPNAPWPRLLGRAFEDQAWKFRISLLDASFSSKDVLKLTYAVESDGESSQYDLYYNLADPSPKLFKTKKLQGK